MVVSAKRFGWFNFKVLIELPTAWLQLYAFKISLMTNFSFLVLFIQIIEPSRKLIKNARNFSRFLLLFENVNVLQSVQLLIFMNFYSNSYSQQQIYQNIDIFYSIFHLNLIIIITYKVSIFWFTECAVMCAYKFRFPHTISNLKRWTGNVLGSQSTLGGSKTNNSFMQNLCTRTKKK